MSTAIASTATKMVAEAGLKKRSITIAGHRTSVSLEDEFWEELQDAARQAAVSLAVLVARIDADRGARSLSSAIRVFLLERAKAGRQHGTGSGDARH